MGHTEENAIYGTTCQSCGVFTPDSLALNPKEARMRQAAPDMYEALMAAGGTLMALVSSKTIEGKTFAVETRIEEINEALAKAEGRS